MPEIHVAYYESPIGLLEVKGGERGVSAVAFVDTLANRAALARDGKGPLPVPLADCLTQLDEYFRGRRRTFSVKLDLGGSIIVPCHRVVGSDGRLTGYGGGLWRKEWLLRHEGNDLPSS